MRIEHTLHESIQAVFVGLEQPLWRYVYGRKPKPYFHPLCTPKGHCLTLFEPHDHFWHRGLWFTFKFINGENFWEEHEPFGIQDTPIPPSVTHSDNASLAITSVIDWIEPERGDSVFQETRVITHRQPYPDCYTLDWDITLIPQADLLLDRTPFTTWGGYGGLTFRGNRNWQNTRLLFSDGSTSDRPTGVRADWCDLSGILDGGEHQSGGIAILDHPDNLRHPSPWYGGTGPGHYFNAALLFHEPLHLTRDQPLHLQYQVVVHDGIWEQDRLEMAYEEYTGKETPGYEDDVD